MVESDGGSSDFVGMILETLSTAGSVPDDSNVKSIFFKFGVRLVND